MWAGSRVCGEWAGAYETTTALLGLALCIAHRSHGDIRNFCSQNLISSNGTGGTMPGRALPSQSPCTDDKELQETHPRPSVGRGRAQEPHADSSDKELLFLQRHLGNVPGCLSLAYHSAGGGRLKAGLWLSVSAQGQGAGRPLNCSGQVSPQGWALDMVGSSCPSTKLRLVWVPGGSPCCIPCSSCLSLC